jgi:hypothetical protein
MLRLNGTIDTPENILTVWMGVGCETDWSWLTNRLLHIPPRNAWMPWRDRLCERLGKSVGVFSNFKRVQRE